MEVTLEDKNNYVKCPIEEIIKAKNGKTEDDWNKFFKIYIGDERSKVIDELLEKKVLTFDQDNAYDLTNDVGNSIIPSDLYFVRKKDAIEYLYARNKMKTESSIEKGNIEICDKTNKKYLNIYYLVHFEQFSFDKHSKLLHKK